MILFDKNKPSALGKRIARFAKDDFVDIWHICIPYFQKWKVFPMNYDVVLHLDSNDPAKMRLVLRNAANYLNALPGEDFQLHIEIGRAHV